MIHIMTNFGGRQMKYRNLYLILALAILLAGCQSTPYTLEGSIQSNDIELPFTYLHDPGSRVSEKTIDRWEDILQTEGAEALERKDKVFYFSMSEDRQIEFLQEVKDEIFTFVETDFHNWTGGIEDAKVEEDITKVTIYVEDERYVNDIESNSGFNIAVRHLAIFHLFRGIDPKDLSFTIEFADHETEKVIKKFTREEIYE